MAKIDFNFSDMSLLEMLSKLLNSTYCLILLLFFFDLLPHFDIKSQALKSFAYLGLLVGTPILLLWNYFAISQRKQQFLGTLYPSIMLIFIINLTPLFIRTSPVPKNIRFAKEWKKVNLDCNELGLKEP
jgi:hypothetical protein